jgi:AbrB family looped-hinge helix DNA binding protein
VAKVTSKLQVTVPKAVADRVGIRPGDDIEWIVDGHGMRVVLARHRRPLSAAERLQIFDEATARQEARNRSWRRSHGAKTRTADRGWTRSEIYTRGRTR